MQSLDQLLQQLTERLQGHELRLNAQRVCRFSIRREVAVSIEEGRPADHFHMYATVASLGVSSQGALYVRLLKAQLFNAELGEGMSFGLDEEAKEILLQQRLALQGINGEEFYQILSLFVSWAMHWTKELSSPLDEVSSSDGSIASVEHFIRA